MNRAPIIFKNEDDYFWRNRNDVEKDVRNLEAEHLLCIKALEKSDTKLSRAVLEVIGEQKV